MGAASCTIPMLHACGVADMASKLRLKSRREIGPGFGLMASSTMTRLGSLGSVCSAPVFVTAETQCLLKKARIISAVRLVDTLAILRLQLDRIGRRGHP